jgi:hypothetical protein
MVVAHAARLAQEAEGASEESGESAAKIVSDVRLPPNLDLHQGVP